ncbi:MAG TPA: tRNA cytidylyltransferase, partial [Anaeromyxobacteraceae bacterium]|nr:tRNA cytidylyltransferase [Anaeromyxobacteraceae bacterium]
MAREQGSLRKTDVPAGVRGVLSRLRAAGHPSWVVGGVVRDLLLGRVRHDPDEFDVATPATPQQVQALFRKVVPTGIEHGTVTVLEDGARVEVTTFRGEGEYVDGRRPSSVTFHGDLDADLARRDFTVNAMAWDPLDGELRDPFGGRRDLSAGRIRAVGEARDRFAEDGLRPLRAVRFVSQLGFRLAPGTRAAIPGALPVVARVSRERMAEELSRLLVGPHSAAGLETLRATGLLGVVL